MMHTPRIDTDDIEDDETTTYNTNTTTTTTSNSSSSTTNKRQRSSTPEQPLAGLNTVSPKRTMSEEHLYSRESSPIVSLPTSGSQAGSVSGGGENAAIPQVPTKMTEVFPPSTSMTNGHEVQEGMSSESIGSGSTAAKVVSDLLPKETEMQGVIPMDVDQNSQGMTNGSGSSSGNVNVESRNIPSLQDQLEVIKRAVDEPLHPDQAFHLIPSSWYLLLRHLAHPTDYPVPKKLPTTSNPSSSNEPTISLLHNLDPSAELLDQQALTDRFNPFYGTSPPPGRKNEFKLRSNLVEFRETGKKGKDVEGEEEGDVVYIAQAGWERIVEWYGNEETSSHAVKRQVVSDAQGNLKIELNPLMFKFYCVTPSSSTTAHGSTGEKPYRMSFSSTTQVSELHDAVRKIFGLDQENLGEGIKPTRLWQIQVVPDQLAAAQAGASGIDPTLDGPGDEVPAGEATRHIASHLLSALSGKHVASYPASDSGKDPLLSESDVEDADCFALEIAEGSVSDPRWLIKVNEAGGAEEVPIPVGMSSSVMQLPSEAEKPVVAPLFSQPSLFPGSGGGLRVSSSEPGRKRQEVVTEKRRQARGLKGLTNLGNTCFMNSGLQCLSNTPELSEYFQRGFYKSEINRQNPLGMKGQVADKFGSLIEQIWSDTSATASGSRSFYGGYSNAVTPREFKQMIGRFAPSFAGYGQQDTQELIAFLLDGLHEDLNRIQKKPYIEKPDWKDGGKEEELALFAKECWEGYKKRNDSVIVDLFQGQLKSTLICPDCHTKSITLDPFMYLTVPIPVNRLKSREIIVQPWDPKEQRIKVQVQFTTSSTYADIKKKVADICGMDAGTLVTADEYTLKFWSYPGNSDSVSDNAQDLIIMHQLPCQVIQNHQGSRIVMRKDQDFMIVPVYTYAGPSDRRSDRQAPPFFIPLTVAQAKDPQVIREKIAERYTGLLRLETASEWEDMLKNDTEDPDDILAQNVTHTVDGLSISQSEKDDRRASSDTHRTSIGSTRTRHLANVFDLAMYSSRKTPEGCLANDPESSRRETVADRKQPKAGMMHRMRHVFDKIGSSSPASEDEEEKPPQQLVFQNDVIAVEWKDASALRHFFGKGGQGRYDSAAAYLSHVDGAIETERRKLQMRSKNGVTLDDCLDEFEREETLGENDLWYCPKCKKHQAATKKMEIYHAPDILVICFKRFGSSGSYYRSKIDTNVDFPVENLNLEDRCDEPRLARALQEQGKDLPTLGLGSATKPMVYDLYAVDQHYGSCGGGHYTAVCKNADDGNWYKFDDSSVNMADVSSAQNSAAYLLFYRRRTEKPLGGDGLAQFQGRDENSAQVPLTSTSGSSAKESLSNSTVSDVPTDLEMPQSPDTDMFAEDSAEDPLRIGDDSPMNSISDLSGNFVAPYSGGVQWGDLQAGRDTDRSRSSSPVSDMA